MSDNPIVLICAFKDEQDAAPGFISDLLGALQEAKLNFRMVLIDDGSTDRTFEILQGFERTDIEIISLSQNLGKIAAQAIGLKSQNEHGDGVIFFDGDGQHSSDQILKVIHIGMSGKKIVVGTRNDNYKRKIFSQIGIFCTSKIFKVLKIQTDLNDAELIYLPSNFSNKISRNSEFGHLPINLIIQHINTEKVPISISNRIGSDNIETTSRHTYQDLMKKALIQIFTKPWEIIYKLFIFAIIPTVFTFGYGLYVGVSNVLSGDKNGIASIIILLSSSTIVLLFLLMLVLVFLASIEQRMRMIAAIEEELRND